jgi:hypothetical protein
MIKFKVGREKKTYDKIRVCLGLEELDSAVEKGKKITNNVRNNLN